jgi:hypothetical protein
VEPSEVHDRRAPWGAPTTAVQAPWAPATSHAWHWPPQAALQHTPSLHWPLAHWLGPLQAAPFASAGVQTPAEQKSPGTQSEFDVQLPRHALAPQTYGLHPCVWRAGQSPAPSQPARSVATAALQLAARQVVAVLGYAQAVALEPSHTPPQTLPSEPHAWRAACGAPITFVQVPTEPGTSQAWHCPLQAALQHTPSTHWPLVHWFAAPQATPGPFVGVQMPAAQ